MQQEIGHVRMRSDGRAAGTHVEVWNGTEWVALLGVMAVSYEVATSCIGVRDGLGYLKLLLWPQSIEIEAPLDQVIMRKVADEMESSG